MPTNYYRCDSSLQTKMYHFTRSGGGSLTFVGSVLSFSHFRLSDLTLTFEFGLNCSTNYYHNALVITVVLLAAFIVDVMSQHQHCHQQNNRSHLKKVKRHITHRVHMVNAYKLVVNYAFMYGAPCQDLWVKPLACQPLYFSVLFAMKYLLLTLLYSCSYCFYTLSTTQQRNKKGK